MAHTASSPDGTARFVSALGLKRGQVVQEFGWDTDTDDDVRTAVEEQTGTELVDEAYGDVADFVLAWWRGDDGDTTDLTDMLVDAQTVLDDGGCVWLLTPKPGRAGHVVASDVSEAATTAGLHATSTFSAAADWNATKLDTRGRGR